MSWRRCGGWPRLCGVWGAALGVDPDLSGEMTAAAPGICGVPGLLPDTSGTGSVCEGWGWRWGRGVVELGAAGIERGVALDAEFFLCHAGGSGGTARLRNPVWRGLRGQHTGEESFLERPTGLASVRH